MEKHLLIRIASFAFLEQNTFTKKDLIDSICPDQSEDQIEKQILNKYFENALNSNSGHNPDLETPFFVFRMDHNLSDRILYSIKSAELGTVFTHPGQINGLPARFHAIATNTRMGRGAQDWSELLASLRI